MEEPTTKYPRGRHPNSLKNIKEHGFKPGKSGNPGGTRKGVHYISEALREILQDPEDVRKIAQRIIKDAMAGNYNAINFLADRTEGKVPLGLTSDGEITIKVVYEDTRSPTSKS
jgi:hypothetical protein